MTVFEGDKIKESDEYPVNMGECPVCEQSAELINNTGVLRKEHIHYKTVC